MDVPLIAFCGGGSVRIALSRRTKGGCCMELFVESSIYVTFRLSLLSELLGAEDIVCDAEFRIWPT